MTPIIDHDILAQVVHRIDPRCKLVRSWTLTGGVSAQVIGLEISTESDTESGAGDHPRKLLLRRHGAADLAQNPQIAADEFRLLQHVHAAGLPVPAPVYVDQSGTLIDSPYIVQTYIEGSTVFAPDNLPDFIRQCATTLARIHRVPSPLPAFLPDRAARVADKLQHRPENLDDSLDEGRIRDALATFDHRAYRENRDKGQNSQCLQHGDFWPGNLLWREGQLVGVIDWEDAAVGDPLYDVAISRLEMTWAFGIAAMQTFTQQYQTAMPHVDCTSLPYWDLVAALRPMHQLVEWAAGWPALGRPDVTEQTMRVAHRDFVAQALAEI